MDHLLPESLKRCIQGSRNEGGCGMSLRPEFTSGRGVVYDDLRAEFLVRMHTCIKTHPKDFPEGAADAFCRMVRDTKILSATDFLLSLQRLAGDGFRWKDGAVEGNGMDLPSDENPHARMGAALGTIGAMLGREKDPEAERFASDEMRNEFFTRIGRTDMVKVTQRVLIDGTYRTSNYDCNPNRSRRRTS